MLGLGNITGGTKLSNFFSCQSLSPEAYFSCISHFLFAIVVDEEQELLVVLHTPSSHVLSTGRSANLSAIQIECATAVVHNNYNAMPFIGVDCALVAKTSRVKANLPVLNEEATILIRVTLVVDIILEETVIAAYIGEGNIEHECIGT